MHYVITPENPAAHLFKVTCTIAAPDERGQIVSLPAWIPGSYMIRDFAKNIVTLSARSDGHTLLVTKQDKSTWQVAPCSGELTLEYTVYAWDLSVRTAHLDVTHGYFNGTSVFLQVHGREDEPCEVDIRPPSGDTGTHWRVATSLRRAGAEPYGFGRYCADNYDDLIDHPVEMADFQLATFDVQGIPHDIVITGRHYCDMDRLTKDLHAICQRHIAMFGALPKLDRYLFLVMVVGNGYGGLEHRSSCSLLCSRDDLPRAGDDALTENYQNFLGLCSHEYFHTWNVKRIKPAGFVPYALAQETYTRQLWAFEGITSYYDDLGLVRSQRITHSQYLTLLAKTITRVFRGSGRFKQSVADSSFDAWTKFYRQDENAPNAIVSYYTKGSLIALALDLTLRLHSDGRKSLDDIMRQLWTRYGQPMVGVPEGEIERIVSDFAGDDVDIADFFNRYLHDTDDPPLASLLEQFGVAMRLRPAENDADPGGKATAKTDEQLAKRPVIGVRTSADNGYVKLTHVFSGSAAEAAGLAAGDIVIAIDRLQVTANNVQPRIAQYRVGQSLIFHVFRRDELMAFEVTLQAPPADTCELSLLTDVDATTAQRRAAWLSGLAAA